jgi:glycosyltransferase involved in cell wall biosynthesis
MGGVEQVMRQICLTTTQAGVNNRIFCLTHQADTQPIQLAEAEVFLCRANFEVASTPVSWQAFATFKKLVDWADLIHYHFPWPFADLLHLVTHAKKPSIVSYHSDIVRQKIGLIFYRPLQDYFLKSVTKIVATSPQYRQSSPVLQKFLAKTEIIPIGLDKASYPVPTHDRLQYWEERLGRGFFLFVGVLRYYKGLHILLQAAEDISTKIVLVGSGPMEAELKAQASRLNLKNIVFLGRVSDEDKVSLLMLSLAVVFPSHLRSEAFGVSLLEGAMYGKPLISAEIATGTSYINLDNETGLVVPPENPQALKKAMQFLYANPDMATQMGKAAEKRYWDYFTAEKMGKSYMQVYKNCLAVS